MTRTLPAFITAILLSSISSAQSSKPLSYNTHEEYCRDNPKMPTCAMNLDPQKHWLDNPYPIYQTPSTAPPGTGVRRAVAAPTYTAPRPSAEVALQDWRFSHSSPAMLISVNVGSLLQSPIWKVLLSGAASSNLKAADIEKARLALSDIGQLLISVTANGTASPSALILAKGNMDGPLSSLLKSGSGMHAKRIDAITLLIGDPHSLEMANLRMRGPATRATHNSLQQLATLEALKYDAWIGIDPRYLASMASVFGGGSNPALAGLARLRGISAGIYLREQIRMEAALEAPSPDMAGAILAAYQQREAKQRGKEPMGQEWVTVEGSTVRFIEIVEASRLTGLPVLDAATSQKVAPQIAALIQQLAGLSAAPRPDSATTTKTTPGVIVIQGLNAEKTYPRN